MRKELKFKSEEEIDAAIKQLSYRLETSSLDLKTEKDIVRDLQKLNGDKERVKEWSTQMDEIKTNRFMHEDLFLQRQAKSTQLNAVRDQEKALLARMDSIRSGEGMPDGFNASARITALLDEKAQMIEAIKAKRAELHSANVDFKRRLGEYRQVAPSCAVCGLSSVTVGDSSAALMLRSGALAFFDCCALCVWAGTTRRPGRRTSGS
jgi:uncharacterized coiled-coil DUF342 family protein